MSKTKTNYNGMSINQLVRVIADFKQIKIKHVETYILDKYKLHYNVFFAIRTTYGNGKTLPVHEKGFKKYAELYNILLNECINYDNLYNPETVDQE